MMRPITSFLLLASSTFSFSNALPFPFAFPDSFMGGESCQPLDIYNKTSEQGFIAPWHLVSATTCDASYSGCQLGQTSGYGVTVSVRTGVSLSLGSIFGLGLNADVSVSTTNSEAITTYLACPSGYLCGLMGRETYLNVTGWITHTCAPPGSKVQGDCTCNNRFEYYEVHLPVLVPGTAKNSQAQVEYAVCVVANSTGYLTKPPSIAICPPFPFTPGNTTNIATETS